MASRTFGVHGKDLPALVPSMAMAAKTNVAGMVFLAEKGPESVQEVYNMASFDALFGGHINGFYGRYEAEGFFANLQGQEALLLCRRFVAPDAVAANLTIENGDTDPAIKFIAGYRGAEDKGLHGNNYRVDVVHSCKTEELLSYDASAAVTNILVEGAINFEVGDYVEIGDTTATAVEYKRITAKDEAAGSVTITPAITGPFLTAQDAYMKTLNFDVMVYKKNSVGVLELKETWQYLQVDPVTTNYFQDVINNEFRGSRNIVAEDEILGVLTGTYDDLLPVATSQGALASGVNGTAPDNTGWNNLLSDFDVEELRHLCNPESTSKVVNDYGEVYCKNRGDAIWYSNLPANMDFEESLGVAGNYCVSNDSYRMNNDGWLVVGNPIGKGIDPIINVPNVGFVMGSAIYWLSKHGYQRVPAGVQEPLKGVQGVFRKNIGTNKQIIITDPQRTRLGDLGVNIIQFVEGSGVCLRNGRMGSNNIAYRYYNQIFMRMFYKITFVDSFQNLENVETGEALLSKMFNAVRVFMLDDFKGNRRTGYKSAFLQVAGSGFEDVVTIICDSSNNSLTDVLSGNVNLQLYFTPPPPAESIEIGVGISLQILANV